MNRIALLCLGQGLIAKRSYSIADKLLGLITLVPLIFLVITPINAASAVVLSLNGYPPWNTAIIGLIAVALAGWGINAFNHFVDRGRDSIIWPERAIPSGRVKESNAIALIAITLISALLLSYLFFNLLNFFILLLAIVFGLLYSAFLRDKIGYLSLPPIVGLISLGGWAAFSPGTLLSSPVPWFLYVLHVFWQAGHIMVYYPLHIVTGQSDKQVIKIPPALFFTPSSKTAVGIGVAFIGLTLILSLLLPLLTSLSYIYLILVFGAGIYGLIMGFKFLLNINDRKQGVRAFAAVSIFRLVSVIAILFDVFLNRIGAQLY